MDALAELVVVRRFWDGGVTRVGEITSTSESLTMMDVTSGLLSSLLDPLVLLSLLSSLVSVSLSSLSSLSETTIGFSRAPARNVSPRRSLRLTFGAAAL